MPPHADAVVTEAKRAEITRGLAHPTIAWGAPPHAFQCEQVIALYFGTDEQVPRALTERCGPQFAGVP